MERAVKVSDAILLFDNYGQDSQSLHTSFKLAGYDLPAAVIEDDGFLPEDVISVYGFFSAISRRRPEAARNRNILMRLQCRITGKSAVIITVEKYRI